MTRSSKKNPLISYLSGEASPLQIQQVESWLNSDESNRELFETMTEAWSKEGEQSVMNLLPPNAPWERKEVESEEDIPHDFVANPFPKGYLLFGIRVAATALILAGIYFLFEGKLNSVWDKANPEMLYAESPVGQDLNIELPKTGNVFLKANSQLAYPAHFGGFAREIILTGEAEFDIQSHRKNQPLYIKVGDSVLEVEQGKFSVSENGTPSIIEIFVEDGALSFKSGSESTPLFVESGHRVIFAYEDNSIYTEKLYSDISLLD